MTNTITATLTLVVVTNYFSADFDRYLIGQIKTNVMVNIPYKNHTNSYCLESIPANVQPWVMLTNDFQPITIYRTNTTDHRKLLATNSLIHPFITP